MTNNKDITIEELEELADRYFHGVENYNCAEAVLAIASARGIDCKNKIPMAGAWGGGRSEYGYCGALYAALSITPEEEKEAATEKFRAAIGNIHCRDIRKANKCTCQDCVIQGCKLVLCKEES